MNDNRTKIGDLKRVVESFVDERDWKQFHSPKNLAMALSVEVSELIFVNIAKYYVRTYFNTHYGGGRNFQKPFGWSGECLITSRRIIWQYLASELTTNIF